MPLGAPRSITSQDLNIGSNSDNGSLEWWYNISVVLGAQPTLPARIFCTTGESDKFIFSILSPQALATSSKNLFVDSPRNIVTPASEALDGLGCPPISKYPGFVKSITVFQIGCFSSLANKSPQESLFPFVAAFIPVFIASPVIVATAPAGPKAVPRTYGSNSLEALFIACLVGTAPFNSPVI